MNHCIWSGSRQLLHIDLARLRIPGQLILTLSGTSNQLDNRIPASSESSCNCRTDKS
jgi:hypothetical protein